jgi:hypothetical protein
MGAFGLLKAWFQAETLRVIDARSDCENLYGK